MKKLWIKSLLTSAVLAGLGLSSATFAGPVDIQLNVGTQPVYAAPGYPPAILTAPPLMVWLSNLGVYAAYGASQPIFYQGSNYYYYYGNRWWSGPGYRGPWRPIAAPPPALRRWNHRDWQRVQRDAGRYSRDPHWRHFRPAERPMPGPQQRPQPGRPGGPQFQHPHRPQMQQRPQPIQRPAPGRPEFNHPGGRPGQGRPDNGPGRGRGQPGSKPDRGHQNQGNGQPWQGNH